MKLERFFGIIFFASILSGFLFIGGQSFSTVPIQKVVKPNFEPKITQGVLPYKTYGDRHFNGINPIFVIHETAESLERTQVRINDKRYTASFHVLLTREGEIINYVPSDKKAYTAGRSRFNHALSQKVQRDVTFEPWFTPYHSTRDEAVLTSSGVPSVNDFAFQVEMVSPKDGYWCQEAYSDVMSCEDNPTGQRSTHEGYTEAQYEALAWLAVKTGIPRERITTHKAVELKQIKPHRDPRHFDWPKFWHFYQAVKDRQKTILL